MSSLVLGLVNLFFDKRCLRVREREFRVSRLDLKCCFQVSLLSRVKPKYLTVSDDGICMLSTDTGGQIPCFSVKVVCTDLLWFSFIRHLEYHCEIRSKCIWRLAEAIKWFSCIAIIALSSAKPVTRVSCVMGWSEAYMLNRRGNRITPWGTPAWIKAISEMHESTWIWKYLSVR